ncbi:hypothetical protein ACQ4PT_064867 [Festuca glaucescens]
MANPAEVPSLPQPAASLQPPLSIAVVPASGADDYDQDIYAYLRSMESAPRRRPAPDYMAATRFLSTARARPTVRSVRVLIIITTAAMLIACKYEEVYPADVEELVDETSRTHGCCTREELLAAEVAVLKALRHELGSPTACTFLEHFMERLGNQAAAH